MMRSSPRCRRQAGELIRALALLLLSSGGSWLGASEARAATQAAYLDASVSGVWSSPSNATGTTNSSCADSGLTENGARVHVWKWDAGTFTIPAGSTIDGLEVVIRYASKEDSLKTELSPDNSAWGTAKNFTDPSGGPQSCPSTDTLTQGSSTDVWGNTWTPTNINDDAYVRLTATKDGEGKSFFVDSIELTVHYTPGATTTISGIVYTDEGTTDIGAGKTVRLLVNGSSAGTDMTDGSGAYSISASVAVGDAILVYIDGDPTYKGTTVTVVDGAALTGLDIYAAHVIARHDDAGSLSNVDMGTALGSFSDADIEYSESGGALTVSGTGTELYVPSGHSYAPGGPVTTPNLESLGTFSGGAGAIDVNGDLVISGGTLTATSGSTTVAGDLTLAAGTFANASGTVALDGTGQSVSGSFSFHHFTKSVASADTLSFAAGSTQTVAGTLTLAGAAANLLSLVSDSPGTRWNLVVSAGATKAVSYVDVEDSDASGSAASQKPIDPANSTSSGNNIDWFYPEPLVQKTSLTSSDPINGTTNPKSIPGAFVRYTITVTNEGFGPVDADTMEVTDPVPANTDLFVGDLGAPGSGPVLFVDGSPASGLTYTFVSLSSTIDDVEFSDDGGTTYAYTPAPDVDSFDPAVTHLRILPKGTFAESDGVSPPSFSLELQVRVD